jgi:GAF domain-containing protein
MDGVAMKARRRKTTSLKRRKHPIAARGGGSSPVNLQKQLEKRTRELAESQQHLVEALEQHTATSKILSAVARSSTDVQVVLDAICESAARLCEAYDSTIWRPDGDRVVLVAHHGPITQVQSVPLVRGTVVGRTVLEKRTLHIADMYTQADEFPVTSELARRLSFRTMLSVPLMREDVVIGTISLRRTEARLFTERQVTLLQTFADQAVIAIENARLFDEVQARTRELSEALEQQTATSEVLQVISSSSGELEPVFQTMLANATTLCEASYGAMWIREEDGFRVAALHGAFPAAFMEHMRSGTVFRPGPNIPLTHVIQTRKASQVADLRELRAYIDGHPLPVAAADIAGVRTLLAIPMLKENDVVGAIAIYRQEVRPFTEKQIALVTNFAAQAVIAIENARLLNELRQRTTDLTESLEQQTATSEVLRVFCIHGCPRSWPEASCLAIVLLRACLFRLSRSWERLRPALRSASPSGT